MTALGAPGGAHRPELRRSSDAKRAPGARGSDRRRARDPLGQSRALAPVAGQQRLAIALMSALGVGLLTWYYAKALTRPAQAQHAAQAAVKDARAGRDGVAVLGAIDRRWRTSMRLPRRPRRIRMRQSAHWARHRRYPRRHPVAWRRRDWLHPRPRGNHRNRLQSSPSSGVSQVPRSHGPRPTAGSGGAGAMPVADLA